MMSSELFHIRVAAAAVLWALCAADAVVPGFCADAPYTVLRGSATALPAYLPEALARIRATEAAEGIAVSSAVGLQFGSDTAYFTTELPNVAADKPRDGRQERFRHRRQRSEGTSGIRTFFDLGAPTVRKRILLKSGGRTTAYTMELEGAGYKPVAVSAGGRDWQVYAGGRDTILYTQAKGASGSPELKEWIYALRPGKAGRTAYSWLVKGSPSAPITLRKEADSGVGIYSMLPVSGVARSDLKGRREILATIEKALKMPVAGERLLGRIEPPVYWTASGEKRKAELEIKGDSDRLEFSIEAAPGDYPLLIDPTLNWGQWFGSDGTEIPAEMEARALAYDAASGELYLGGVAFGQPDESVPTSGICGGDGCAFVAELSTGTTPSLKWVIFSGGYGAVEDIAVNGDEIYAGGTAYYGSVLWGAAAVTQGTNSGSNEGFVVEIGDGASPSLNWLQWLGGTASDGVLALAVNGDEIYAGGYAGSATSWESAASNQGSHSGLEEGFVVEIADGASPSLNWLQWLGGTGSDDVLALAVNGDEIYAGGYAGSATSWESATSNQGAHSGLEEGFVVEIADGVNPALNWRQWLGGTGNDNVTSLGVNGDEVYAGGHTSGITSWESATSNQGSYSGGTEGFVVEIADGANPVLNWRFMLGGIGSDRVLSLSFNGDEIYAAGYATSVTSWESATYNQGTHSGNYEGFVCEIQDNPVPVLNWRQWLGGVGANYAKGIRVSGDDIYVGGYATSGISWEALSFQGTHNEVMESFTLKLVDGAPPSLGWGQWLGSITYAKSYVYAVAASSNAVYVGGYACGDLAGYAMSGTYSGVCEGFVFKVISGTAPTISWGQWLGGDGDTYLAALAVNGDEIYAGGYSNSATAWESATSNQGTFSGPGEGFVVEIADGATPVLNWRQWLGGDGYTNVYALAVNGDEIYAGGDSDSATAWESATSNQGTFSGAYEGFVVEIADGATPVLNWRQWLGGDGYTYLAALAVNGDEIYAGGDSDSATAWESATSNQGTFSGTGECFVVEIGDGASPVLNWRQWLGGDGETTVYALAVNGDEIYAGGDSDSATAWESATSNQGTFSGAYEGFVVEIADGATPVLNWRQWLGGNDSDHIWSIVLRGEDIYAVGSSYDATGWEPAAIERGDNSVRGGIVVAVSDGAVPKLNWRYWFPETWGDGAALSGDVLHVGGDSSVNWTGPPTFYGDRQPNISSAGLIKLLLPCDACFQSPGF